MGQVDTFPRNIALFEKAMVRNEARAQQLGGAPDPLMGEPAPSGTPFRAQERQVIEGKGIHEYRKGKIAVSLNKIYMDWILPDMIPEMLNEKEFFAELNWKEQKEILDAVYESAVSRIKIDMVLDLKVPYDDEVRLQAEAERNAYARYGKTMPLKILKDEMKGAPLAVRVNIAGKQKNLVEYVDKLSNAFNRVFSTYNPQTRTFAIFDDPRMLDWFNQILEKSDLDPIDMGNYPQPVVAPQGMFNPQENAPVS